MQEYAMHSGECAAQPLSRTEISVVRERAGACPEDVCHSHIQQRKSRLLDEGTSVTQEYIENALMVVLTKISYKITKHFLNPRYVHCRLKGKDPTQKC